MQAVLKDIARRRELLGILVLRNIKIRYKESVLGVLWTMTAPVFMILVYAFFLRLMKFQMPLEVLVTGIFVWQYLAMCLGDAPLAVVGSSNLVKKASFPRILLPLSTALANGVNFLLSMVIVAVFVRMYAGPFGVLWVFPLALITHTALCTGISLILSALNVFFRDVQHIVGIVGTAWFFLTPVIYDESILGQVTTNPLVYRLFHANPMTGVLSLYRHALIGAPLPDAVSLVMSVGISWLVLGAGVVLFQRLQSRFADEL